ncbi:MAG: protein phosphatase 2C domain-containing protein, partial [Actinomycetota bacterium]
MAETGASVAGRWFVGTGTAAGIHVEGNPNQDAAGFVIAGDSVAIAVADGHSGPRHFRSDRGAQFAVDAACEAGAGLSGKLDALSNIDAVIALLAEQLLPDLVDRW